MDKSIKKLIVLVLVVVLSIQFSVYAKVRQGIEVDEPKAEGENNNISEAIIYDNSEKLINPATNVDDLINKEEYNSVNNYNINIDTLKLRIQYFSPNYTKSKMTVVQNDIVSNGMRGSDTVNTIITNLDDSNGTLLTEMESLVQNATNTLLNYLETNKKFELLTESKKVYDKLKDLYIKNYGLGLATALDVSKINVQASTVNTQLNQCRTQLSNYKRSLALQLGYDLKDLSKLTFTEPTVDLTKFTTVNLEDDFKKALTRDTTYNSVLTTGDESSKLPGSTGEYIYRKKVETAENQVRIDVLSSYSTLINKLALYKNNQNYLSRIISLKQSENTKKYKEDLISEVDYLQNQVTILQQKYELAKSKYDLIKEWTSYYYRTLLY